MTVWFQAAHTAVKNYIASAFSSLLLDISGKLHLYFHDTYSKNHLVEECIIWYRELKQMGIVKYYCLLIVVCFLLYSFHLLKKKYSCLDKKKNCSVKKTSILVFYLNIQISCNICCLTNLYYFQNC